MPQTPHDWKIIAENFREKLSFPNCVGAIDGKHVTIKAPGNSGSLFYNYKGTFSLVLLAIADANLKFIYIDVGAYGKNSDGGIFANSTLGKAVFENKLNLPAECILPEAQELGSMPYVFVGDEAFPLLPNLMRPYPGRCASEQEQFFNYRLSRARRIVENAFGVLAARWRVFNTRIAVQPDTSKLIVMACCVLHNMLQTTTNTAQNATAAEVSGNHTHEGLQQFRHVGNRATKEAINIRENFKRYFIERNPLTWQNQQVRRGLLE